SVPSASVSGPSLNPLLCVLRGLCVENSLLSKSDAASDGSEIRPDLSGLCVRMLPGDAGASERRTNDREQARITRCSSVSIRGSNVCLGIAFALLCCEIVVWCEEFVTLDQAAILVS